MQIEEITIQGKPYPVAFGMRAFNTLCQAQGMAFGSPESIGSSLELYVQVLQIALNEGARKQKLSERYTEDDVVDLFDDEPSLVRQVATMLQQATEVYIENLGSLGK